MKSHRKTILIGAAALTTVAGAGGAIAATQLGSPREESQAVVEDAAEELGVTPAELRSALRNALAKRVDAAVGAGRLTEEQGERQKERIHSGKVPLFFGPAFHGPSGGGRFFPFGPRIIHLRPFRMLADAASYLDLSEAELRAELNSGKTLADVARSEDKSVEGLVDALTKAEKSHLDEAAEQGRLPEARRDELAANLKERMRALVNERFRGGHVRPVEVPGPPGSGALFLGPFHGLEDAAAYLDLTEAELRSELAEGKTLAEVARAEDKSVDGLVDALTKAETERLDEAVEAGRLSDARRDELVERLEERSKAFVNGERGPFRRGPKYFGFAPFRGGTS
jgi:hypothetical protein